MTKKRGRPPAANPKVNLGLRVTPQVREFLKAQGNVSAYVESVVVASKDFRASRSRRGINGRERESQ